LKKSLSAACAGMLLMACSGMQTTAVAPAPGVDVINTLEQACLLDPLNASKWERLAAELASNGERERAAVMYLQAATLRAHDVQADYALLRQGVRDAREDEAAALAAAMPRTEVRQMGAAMVQVLRIPAAHAVDGTTPASAPTSPTTGSWYAAPSIIRLEISNGNGVTGAAARLAQSLDVEGLKTVRLSNVRPFTVPLSRIEYQSGQKALAQTLSRRLNLPLHTLHTLRGNPAYADMRIVLGHDATQATYLK
jgi:hypothetical protein